MAFLPGLFAIILTFFVKEKKKEISIEKKQKVNFLTYLKYWRKAPILYKRLVAGLLLFTFFNSTDALLLLNLNQHGFSDVSIIGFYVFYNLVYALLSYPAGILADKLGMKKILVFGLLIFSIVYFSMGFASSFIVFGILFFLYAFYAASTESIAKAWITNISEKSETATAIGFFTSFSSILTMIASIFAGILWLYFSPAVTFIVSGIGVGLVVIFLILFVKGKND